MSLQTLIPEVTVAGLTLRPWSLGQLTAASPHVAAILEKAEELGFNVAKAMDGKFDETKLARLLLVSMPSVVELLAVSVKKPRAELEDLDLPAAVELVKAAAQVNWDHLKNSFAPPAAAKAGAKKTS
jgi:hypothetical protein